MKQFHTFSVSKLKKCLHHDVLVGKKKNPKVKMDVKRKNVRQLNWNRNYHPSFENTVFVIIIAN